MTYFTEWITNLTRTKKGEINKSNYRKVYENNSWLIVEPLDWQTSMALGEGTTWCITGRYDTNGEVKPSQAEKYFNEYLDDYYMTYYFVYGKKNGQKYCICPKIVGDVDIWNKKDKLIDSKKLIRLIGEEGIKSMDLGAALPDENGFVISRNGSLKKYEGDKEEIVIPNNVKEIERDAFSNCHYLQSVTIPSSVEKIGGRAFYNCRSLRSITISNGVKRIGYCAFAYCYDLQSITIPGSVKEIELSTFIQCKSLQSVTILNGVEVIGSQAFYYCESLQSITIPSSVKEIRANTFSGCDSLRSIYINDERTVDVILENNPHVKDKIVLR